MPFPVRPVSLTLVTVGALALGVGALGLALQATTDVAVASPALAAGLGLWALLAGLALRVVLGADPARAAAAGPSAALALAAFLLAVPVLAMAATSGLPGFGDDAPVERQGLLDDAAPLLDAKAFEGRVGGANLPLVGGVGESRSLHEVELPDATRHVRVELDWDVSRGGAERLTLAIEVKDAEGGWQQVAQGEGGPGLAVDALDLPEGTAQVRILVQAPEGSAAPAGQEFEGVVSCFTGAIPEGHTALP